MKITSVDIIEVKSKHDFSAYRWRPVVVRINTDKGLSGFGEVGLAYGAGASAGMGMAKDLAGIILGMDPMRVEEIWNKMQKKTFWGQGGGTVVSAAMSGIDIALWDIRGKALNTPIYQLLGGLCRDGMRAYASQLQTGWGKTRNRLTEPEQYADAAREALEEGYTAVKVDPLTVGMESGYMVGQLSAELRKTGYDRMKAIRDAVGPDTDIILELHSLTDAGCAIQFANACEELGIYYLEEPVAPLNSKLMKHVADNVNMPVASGERIYTRWGYRPFFEDGSLAVIQPDMCTAGGFTEVKKICDLGHIYDVSVQVHVCGGPISVAAALHMEASIPNFIIHEVHHNSVLDINVDSCTRDYQPTKGVMPLPEGPGLGQELTAETIAISDVVTVN